MRLPVSAHTSKPWRIHEIAPDFAVEDVWALPTPGGPDDFPRLLALATTLDPEQSASTAVRGLFALRWKIGGLFGWDDEKAGTGARVPTLRDRLPVDLRDEVLPAFRALPFTALYRTDDEFAAEIANQTAHALMHLAWVPDDRGGYRGQMAVLVKRNGLFGAAYMAAIKPFRHLIVYPRMMREFGAEWADSPARASSGRTRTRPLPS
jgi:Protein of unknown function (DUF2867)